jgi:hypothetical protein
MEETIKRAIDEWLRDGAPIVIQMGMLPENRDALVFRIAEKLRSDFKLTTRTT